MAATTKKPVGFDLKVFEQMQEPISMRIERKNPRSGQMEPIPLPQSQWSKEDARRIENIILKDVAGGGSYRGQMIGAGGKTMEWLFAFPTNLFPELIPPGSADALGHPAAVAPPAVAGTPAAVPPWQSGAYGQPLSPPAAPVLQGYQSPVVPQMAPQMAPAGFGYGGYPQMPYMQPQAFNPYAYQPPPQMQSTPRGGSSPELDAVKAQLAESKRHTDEERHVREREQQAASNRADAELRERKHSEEMRAMREQIAKLGEQPKTRPGDDPSIIAMKAANDTLQKQMDEQRRINDQQQAEQRRQAEAQTADQRHRDEMRAMSENNQRQMDSMKEMIAKMGENKSDPMMMALVEMQRGQQDAARETSRQQADATRESARQSAEQPRNIVEMMSKMREASGGEQMLSNIGTAYANANQMMMQAMEAMAGMGQSPGMALAEGALASGKEVLEKIMMGKRDEALAKERTQQVASQAQAQAQQTEAYYAAQRAGVQDAYRDENGNIVAQPIPRDQIGAAQTGTVDGVEQPEVVDSVPPGTQQAATAEPAATTDAEKRDVELFGPLLGHVKELREAVAADKANPETVAQVIIEAMIEIDKESVTVPAFSLVLEDRWAELMDLVLPTVSSEFAGETIQHLQTKLKELGIEFPDAPSSPPEQPEQQAAPPEPEQPEQPEQPAGPKVVPDPAPQTIN